MNLCGCGDLDGAATTSTRIRGWWPTSYCDGAPPSRIHSQFAKFLIIALSSKPTLASGLDLQDARFYLACF